MAGIAIDLSDTAGIRDATDAIEQEGINRARTELADADVIVEVIDDSELSTAGQPLPPQNCPIIRVYNKIDLSNRPAGRLPESPATRVISEQDEAAPRSSIGIAISAASGKGIESLEHAIVESLGMDDSASATPFSARERHVDCLKKAHTLLSNATDRFIATGAGELLAEDLRDVHHTLSTITGEFGSDDLLGEIFSSFCIGK